MLIDWVRFTPALLLLLTPIAIFHGHRVHYRALRRDWEGYWGRAASLGLHAIDFGRAMIGAWLLFEAVKATPGASGLLRQGPIVVQTFVLCLATLLQTMICKEQDAAHAPFAFVSGLAAGFLPPLIAVFAFVLAVIVAFGTRSGTGFFPMLSISIVGIGVLLTGRKAQFVLAAAACAVVVPWLLTLLFPRTLMATYLARHTKRTVAAPLTDLD